MKSIAIISILLFVGSYGFGQIVSDTVLLDSSVYIIGEMEDFNAKSHKVDTCDTGLDWDFVCLIDGSPWYGSDAGLFFPRNQLNKLVITIDGINIDLETAGMYNINFKKVLRKKQFSLVKSEFGYRLYAFFSDGAGTYTVHWKIVGNKSLREVISNDERYFEWQIRKELK